MYMTNGFANKRVPTGFSWTTLFFGPFPSLFRGNLGWAVVLFILALLTWGLSNVVFAFFINDKYAESLYERGYRKATRENMRGE